MLDSLEVSVLSTVYDERQTIHNRRVKNEPGAVIGSFVRFAPPFRCTTAHTSEMSTLYISRAEKNSIT